MDYYLLAYIAMGIAVGTIAVNDGTVEATAIKNRIYGRGWIQSMYVLRFLVQGATWPIYIVTNLLYKVLK